jgi:hypothetical protein
VSSPPPPQTTSACQTTALLLCALLGGGGCKRAPDVQLWVDGFVPEQVRFETKGLGVYTDADWHKAKARADVDGVLPLPAGSCPQPGCRVAEISVYVENHSKDPFPPPVVRLHSPPDRPRRLPIAFGAAEVSPGRVGRIRWLVALWPEEQRLTATLSSSVVLMVDGPAAAPAPPAAPDPDTDTATATDTDTDTDTDTPAEKEPAK